MANDFLWSYLPYLLQRADQLLSENFHRELAALGMTVSEWRVLAVLRDEDTRTVGDLSAATMLPQPTTTHAITRLVDDGLVLRRDSTHDRRRKVISLTEAGRLRADELVARASASEDAALAVLDPAGRDDLLAQVQLLVTTIDEELGRSDEGSD